MLNRLAIIWSSSPYDRNGQAMVTRRVFEIRTIRWISCFYEKGAELRSFTTYFSAISRLFFGSICHPKAPVYAVVSRSRYGFARDLPVLLLALCGRRVISHFHGSDVTDLLTDSRVGWLARKLYRRCEVVVPSYHLVELVSDLTGRAAICCENFTLVDQEASPACSNTALPNPIRVVWNSNIISSKGFFETLAAIDYINSRGHHLEFTVLGEVIGDEERSRIEANELLLTYADRPWLKLMGSIPAGDAARVTLDNDVVVLPSRYRSECQPLALIQAMCLRKIIVCTDTPAIRATLGEYPAIYTSDSSVQSLVSAFDYISSDLPINGKLSLTNLETQSHLARKRFSAVRFDESVEAIIFSA